MLLMNICKANINKEKNMHVTAASLPSNCNIKHERNKIFLNALKFTLVSIVIIAISTQQIYAYTDSQRSYTYDEWGNSIESPAGYKPNKVIFASDMGVDYIDSPEDFFVDSKNNIYILDTGNDRVIIVDKNYNLIKIIDTFTLNGVSSQIFYAQSIFVDTNEIIYIADTTNSRIISLNQNGEILQEYTKPSSDIFPQAQEFRPKKVLVDQAGIVYGICTGIYFGAVMYSPNGEFLGFFGSNRVEMSINLLIDRFWKSIFYKQENQDIFRNYIPIEYSSFDIDDERFIYTCTAIATSPSNLVRKLNSTGINVFDGLIQNSFQKGFGDLNPSVINGSFIQSKFIDINIDGNGNINCLDFERGRIFQYSQDTNLLFVFGGRGEIAGSFNTPTAIESIDDKILVLDSGTNSITEFKITEFGKKVHVATDLFNQGKYIEAIEPWEDVIKYNSNYNLAYIGIGKAKLQLDDYKSAMHNFMIGKYPLGYDMAFKEQRTKDIRGNFNYIIFVLIALYVLSRAAKSKFAISYQIKAVSAIKNNRFGNFIISKFTQIGESKDIIFHPIEGYNEFYFKKSGNLGISIFFALALFVSLLINTQFTGFAFNSLFRPEDLNIAFIFTKSIGVALLFSIVNWSLCTLFDGKGRVKDIWYALAYSSVPYIISLLFVTLMSNFLINEESIFLIYILAIGQIYSTFLVIKGLEAAHKYTFIKTLISTIATIVGMVLVIVLVILSFSLIQQIIGFFVTITKEYNLRYR